MFADREPEINPRFITRVGDGADIKFPASNADGLWYRVKPCCAREVFFIQMLTKGIHTLVPESGDGILIRADSIPYR